MDMDQNASFLTKCAKKEYYDDDDDDVSYIHIMFECYMKIQIRTLLIWILNIGK